mmetsp:Transcript_20367/g.47513  ORF Transcript_20367/g.47513 Transcript_20367/m.47513 type:complete len:93 (-) Transcript_20367:1781-2059(-)
MPAQQAFLQSTLGVSEEYVRSALSNVQNALVLEFVQNVWHHYSSRRTGSASPNVQMDISKKARMVEVVKCARTTVLHAKIGKSAPHVEKVHS